ncbi:MAG: hypothetical protein ACR2OU_18540 [Thermomicrobiales bacterium]
MKRYRVLLFDFDSTASWLKLEIGEDWDEEVKALHVANYNQTVDETSHRYGAKGLEAKVQNLLDLENQAFSILSYHNRFYRQARTAFIMGAYYPALTAAGALGERILNHLVLELREEFQSSGHYKRIARKKSFDNWDVMISALEDWSVLLPEVASEFRKLGKLRHHAVHFNEDVAALDREYALEALLCLNTIINVQFGALGLQPWFIPGMAGVSYIARDWESNPFVRLVYLPASAYVGPKHDLDLDQATMRWIINDDHEYEDRVISDSEFAELLELSLQQRFEEARGCQQ